MAAFKGEEVKTSGKITVFDNSNQKRDVKSIYVKVNNQDHYALQVYTRVNNTWMPAWNYEWIASAWSACNKKCDTGTRSRTVSCVRNDGHSTYTVNSDYCNKLMGSNPHHLVEACNTQPCNVNVCLVGSIDDYMNFWCTNNLNSAKNNSFWKKFSSHRFGNTKEDNSGTSWFSFKPAYDGPNGGKGKMYAKLQVWDTNNTHQGCNIGIGFNFNDAANRRVIHTGYVGAAARTCVYRFVWNMDTGGIKKLNCQRIEWDGWTYKDCGSFCEQSGWTKSGLCPNHQLSSEAEGWANA